VGADRSSKIIPQLLMNTKILYGLDQKKKINGQTLCSLWAPCQISSLICSFCLTSLGCKNAGKGKGNGNGKGEGKGNGKAEAAAAAEAEAEAEEKAEAGAMVNVKAKEEAKAEEKEKEKEKGQEAALTNY
jgi:hypothetical protein